MRALGACAGCVPSALCCIQSGLQMKWCFVHVLCARSIAEPGWNLCRLSGQNGNI